MTAFRVRLGWVRVRVRARRTWLGRSRHREKKPRGRARFFFRQAWVSFVACVGYIYGRIVNTHTSMAE
eukprot:3328383-Prymnesium_polylepis.1